MSPSHPDSELDFVGLKRAWGAPTYSSERKMLLAGAPNPNNILVSTPRIETIEPIEPPAWLEHGSRSCF